MNITVYKQENYLQALGSSQGYTIARYGCALVCLTSLSNWFGRSLTPDQLNAQLAAINGFASNGTVNSDGTVNKTLLSWGALTELFGEIKLEHNIAYPSQPADMEMIDAYLVHNQPVVVGVSFLHNSNDTVPSHYVLIYRKNADGTYQMMDPWFGDDTVFDTRYAVNGMSVANAILQVICYSGPVPPPVPTQTPAPDVAHPQQAVTPTDVANSQATANYSLYLQQVDINKGLNDRITELQQQVTDLQNANTQIANEISNTKTLNATLSTQIAHMESSDSAAIETAQKQIDTLKEKEVVVNAAADALHTKPTLSGVLSSLDSVLSFNKWAKNTTEVKNNIAQAPRNILVYFGFEEGVKE